MFLFSIATNWKSQETRWAAYQWRYLAARYLKMLRYPPAMLCYAMPCYVGLEILNPCGQNINLIMRAMFSCYHHHHHHYIWNWSSYLRTHAKFLTITNADSDKFCEGTILGWVESWKGLPVPNGRNAHPRWTNLVMGSIYPPFQQLLSYVSCICICVCV